MRRASSLATLALAVGVAAGALTAPAHADVTRPVVFVHGYMGDAATWTTAVRTFGGAGYTTPLLNAYVYDSQADLRTSAEGLKKYVAQVKASTGASTVDIVNHSMGGLVTRWYLAQLNGTTEVAHVASLAGANHGTSVAGACSDNVLSCQQMMPDSEVVTALNSGRDTPAPTRYATWYSYCDGVIHPYDSPALQGADNHNVDCLFHTQFPDDATVLTQVMDFLHT